MHQTGSLMGQREHFSKYFFVFEKIGILLPQEYGIMASTKKFMRTEIDEAIIQEREDGIVHVHFKEGTEINVKLQGKMYDIYNEVCGDTHKPFLFSADEYVTITKEARDNAIIMEAMFPGAASAVIAPSVAYKLVANFYLLVNKPKNPYKVFSDEEAAIAWLKNYL